MTISYDTLNKLQWCNLNPNDTLVDLEDSSFEGLYNGGWSTRPNLPPTITLSDTINFVLDKKSSFAVKQLGEFLKSQDVSLTDIDEVPNTALKDAIAKASNKYIDGRIVQVTGQNKDKIMSQKAVTDYMKSMSDDIDNNLKVKLESLQTEVDNVSKVANDAIPNSKKTSELGTSTDLVATQKLVNDVNTKAVNAQTTANNAIPNSKKTSELGTSTDLVATQKLVNDVNTKAVNAQTKADQAHTLANNAIPNSKKTSVLGTSTDLVATQKLANDVNTKAVNAQTKADQAHSLATTANNTANTAYKDKGNLGEIDLNTLGANDKFGVYYQTANANATTARNYPVALAGTLHVTKSAYGCQQMYIPFSSGDIYVRGLSGSWNGSNGPWYPWKKISSSDGGGGLGYGWYPASHAVGSTYVNNYGKTILVQVLCTYGSGSNTYVHAEFSVNKSPHNPNPTSSIGPSTNTQSAAIKTYKDGVTSMLSVYVPPGVSYKFTNSSGSSNRIVSSSIYR